MAISPESIEEVKSVANVYDVISEYLNLEKAGSSYKALCPFHSEKTPSFYVSPQKNIWKCFGCGKSGNAISFLIEYEGISYSQAIMKLAEKYNIKLKFTGKNKYLEHKSLYELLKKVANFYQDQLKKSPKVRKYISDRGILPSTIDKFEIGYSPDDDTFIKWVEKEGINKEELIRAGVISSQDSKRDKFTGRVIFPIKDIQGRIVGFGGRSIDGKNPKYLNSPETDIYKKSKILYGLFDAKDFIREEKEVFLVEGYFDVISPFQIGVKNIVATLGTSLTLHHAKLLKKFADKVYILFDSDEAGKKAAIRAAKILLHEGLDIYYHTLEDKDPDELAKKGYKAFKEEISKSKNFLDFLIERIKLNQNPKNRKKLIDIFLDIISYSKDKVLIGEYINQLSNTTGIDKVFLEVKPKKIEEGQYEDDSIINIDSFNFNEKIIIKSLIKNKDYTLQILNQYDKIIGSEYFNYLIEYIKENKIEYENIKGLDNIPSDEKSLKEAIEKLVIEKKKEEVKMVSLIPQENSEKSLKKIWEEIKALKQLDPKFNNL